MPLLGASLEVISTEKTFRNLTFFRENYSSLILIVVKDSLNFIRLLWVVITPSVIEEEKTTRSNRTNFRLRERETVIIPLNPKLSFVLFVNRGNTCMSITGQFQYEMAFWKYSIIFLVPLHKNSDSGEGPRILGRFPGEGRDILIPYVGRVILFSSLNWKSLPPLPPANFWQVP